MDKIQFQKDIFNRKTSYKPLAVNIKAPSRKHELYDAMRDPNKAIENSIEQFEKTKEVNSDLIPYIESNFMEALIPTLFGAETHTSPGGLIDVKPIFSDIYETEKLGEIDIYSGEMENAIKHLEYIRDNAPSYLYVNPTRPMSPLDYAVVLCGGNFYMELLAEPELSYAFMEKITDATIKTIKIFKDILNQPLDECMTVRGFCYPGIRLTGDAIVNLSPTMIEDVMCPLYKKFEAEFSKVMLHYCCTPAPSTHVIHALGKGGGIDCVDNWQGYQTLISDNILQDKISVCTDILNNEDLLSENLKNDEFFKFNGRPLFTSVTFDNVEDGKRGYDIWRNMWEKRYRI